VVEDPLFKTMAMFLDTPSYQFHEFGYIVSEVNVIVNWFKILLEANGCNVARIEDELETVIDHVKQFMPRNAASKFGLICFHARTSYALPTFCT
jgi:hypothetical protein